MQHLFTFLQYNGYNKNPLWARIVVECIKVSAACLSRLLQEQQEPPVQLLEARPVQLLEARCPEILRVSRRSEEEPVLVLFCHSPQSPWGCRNGRRFFELQDHSHLNSLVLPAPHRRGLQERGAPAKQRAIHVSELQFGVVRLLNIPTWYNCDDGRKHTGTWTRFMFRTYRTSWRFCWQHR